MTLPQVATSGGLVNGFAKVLHYNGKVGWVSAAAIRRYQNPVKPNGTCTFEGVRPDGILALLMRRVVLGLAALVSSSAAAQVPVTGQGIPPQIIPKYTERGAPPFTVGGLPGAGVGIPSSRIIPATPSPSGGSSDPVAALAATDFGDVVFAAANQAGISAASLAGIGQVESGFRDVPTANGSSSATGPWQITTGTWQSTVASHGLDYSTADMTDPSANAVVASHVIHDYANTVSNAIGRPATTLDAYGAYLFGTEAGSQLAAATDASLPLSISASNHWPITACRIGLLAISEAYSDRSSVVAPIN